MVDAMTKAVSAMTVQRFPTSSRGTQYQGASSYIVRPSQPQLAHGANGTLGPSVTCFYCKDTGHVKDNCVCLNNKIVHELGPGAGNNIRKDQYKNRYDASSDKKIMAPQTLDQSDGEKVCGPDQIDITNNDKGNSGFDGKNIQPAGLCSS